MTQQTNVNGDYIFPALASRNIYSLSLSFEDSFSNGLSTVDMLMIRNHIIGLNVFEAPYKVVSADLSNDGTLSVTDLVILQKLILGTQDTISNGEAWKFADRNELLTGNLIPFPQIDIFNYDDLRSGVIANFVGIKAGDVNSSAVVNGLDVSEKRSIQHLNIQDRNLDRGGVYKIDVNLNTAKTIEGFQLAFDYKDINIIEIVPANFDIDGSNFVVRDDHFNVIGIDQLHSNEGSTLFRIILKSMADQLLSTALTNKINGLSSEAYVTKDLEIVDLKLVFKPIASQLAITQIAPNPFTDHTQVNFTGASNSQVLLKVYKLTGELLYQDQLTLGTIPNNSFNLNSSDLSYSGLCFIELSDGRQVTSSKLLVLSN